MADEIILLKKLPDFRTDRSNSVYTGVTAIEEEQLRSHRNEFLTTNFPDVKFHNGWKTLHLLCATDLVEWGKCSLPTEIKPRGIIYMSVSQVDEFHPEKWRGKRVFHVTLTTNPDYYATPEANPLGNLESLHLTISDKYASEATLTKALGQIGLNKESYTNKAQSLSEVVRQIQDCTKDCQVVGYNLIEGLLAIPGLFIDLSYVRDLSLLEIAKGKKLDKLYEELIGEWTVSKRSVLHQRNKKIEGIYQKIRETIEPSIGVGRGLPLPFLKWEIVVRQMSKVLKEPTTTKRPTMKESARDKRYKPGTQPRMDEIKYTRRMQAAENRRKAREAITQNLRDPQWTDGAKLTMVERELQQIAATLDSYKDIVPPVLAEDHDDPDIIRQNGLLLEEYQQIVAECTTLANARKELLLEQTAIRQRLEIISPLVNQLQNTDIGENITTANVEPVQQQLREEPMDVMARQQMEPEFILEREMITKEQEDEDIRKELMWAEVQEAIDDLNVDIIKGINDSSRLYQEVNKMLNSHDSITKYHVVWCDRGRLCVIAWNRLFPIPGTLRNDKIAVHLDFVLDQYNDIPDESWSEDEIQKRMKAVLTRKGISFPEDYPPEGQDKTLESDRTLMKYLPAVVGAANLGYLNSKIEKLRKSSRPFGTTVAAQEWAMSTEYTYDNGEEFGPLRSRLAPGASDLERRRLEITKSNKDVIRAPGWMGAEMEKLTSSGVSPVPKVQFNSAAMRSRKLVIDKSIYGRGFPSVDVGSQGSSVYTPPSRSHSQATITLPLKQPQVIKFMETTWLAEGEIFLYKVNGKASLVNQTLEMIKLKVKHDAYASNMKDLTTIYGPYIAVLGTRFAEREDQQYLNMDTFLNIRKLGNLTSEEQEAIHLFETAKPKFEPSFGTFAIEVGRDVMKYVISTTVIPVDGRPGWNTYVKSLRMSLPRLSGLEEKQGKYFDTMVPRLPKTEEEYEKLCAELAQLSFPGNVKARIHYAHLYQGFQEMQWCRFCNALYLDGEYGVAPKYSEETSMES